MEENTTNKKLWFKRKRYGWGWQPSSWEGWLVIAIYLVAVLKISILLDVNQYAGSQMLTQFVLPCIVLTLILILICYKKGEKPKWTWGKD